MRILFINTFGQRGGAAIVASRLATVLEQHAGAEVLFLAAYNDTSRKNVKAVRGKFGEFAEKVMDKISGKLGFQYQFFPFSGARILAEVRRFRPDVISLHNTHGGYFQTSLIERISMLAPVVWTLHDMWSFTGNAAHTFGDESWKSLQNSSHLKKIYPAIGINRGSALLKQKKSIYRRANLSIVTPSDWLGNLARQSPVFEGIPVQTVNNGVDLNVFRPYDKKECREALSIPVDAKVIMFSADFLKDNIWKGGKELIAALQRINEKIDAPIHLLIAGAGELEGLGNLSRFVIRKTGFIREEEAMARCMSASDIFLYPTRADTLPNVLVEAMACGLPCVTFDIGGCSEIVTHQQSGVVVPPADVEGMANAVISLIRGDELKKMRVAARKVAEEKFSLPMMREKYESVFKQAIAAAAI